MENLDFNLLLALDTLLCEGSVTGAAHRLGLSSSAMSRTLSRLRSVTGDPLLVRAGRGLVLTPRAANLRDQVHELTHQVQSVLSPQSQYLDIATLDRTFVICANEGFIELFSTELIAAVTKQAPRARLRFAPKPGKDVNALRAGLLDIEIGVLNTTAPEVITRLLFRARFVGVAGSGHPLISAPVTAEAYASSKHVVTSRKGQFNGPVDDALSKLGLKRDIVAVVPSFRNAMRIAQHSDLIALAPRLSGVSAVTLAEMSTVDLVSFDLPICTPHIEISAMWHPRMQADPAHLWLRNIVSMVCQEAPPLRNIPIGEQL